MNVLKILSNYLDKEDMMGHSVGLERHYERYQEEDFERFSEYQKAISFLTISEEERARDENVRLRKEKSELARGIIVLKSKQSRTEDKVERLLRAMSEIDPKYAEILDIKKSGPY